MCPNVSVNISFRIPPESYLQVSCDAFVKRQAPLWSAQPAILQWLADCSQRVLQDITPCAQELMEANHTADIALSEMPALEHYQYINRDDFSSEIPRFPEGVQPLEDHLMDPQILEGNVRFPEMETYLDSQQVELLVQRDSLSMMNSQSSRRWVTAIDLNRPLLQLFLATLMPWIEVPRFYR